MRADRSTPTSRRAYGARSGPHNPVPHPASSTSRLFDASTSGSARIAATRAGARYDSLASLESKVAAKLSKVISTNASDARGGTSRQEHRLAAWSGRDVPPRASDAFVE